MKKLFTILCLTAAVTSLFAQNNKSSLQADINAFDSYVQKTMQDWQIPGMAVAIVKNNEIIFSKGWLSFTAWKGANAYNEKKLKKYIFHSTV